MRAWNLMFCPHWPYVFQSCSTVVMLFLFFTTGVLDYRAPRMSHPMQSATSHRFVHPMTEDITLFSVLMLALVHDCDGTLSRWSSDGSSTPFASSPDFLSEVCWQSHGRIFIVSRVVGIGEYASCVAPSRI
jgi:hypothetical protein